MDFKLYSFRTCSPTNMTCLSTSFLFHPLPQSIHKFFPITKEIRTQIVRATSRTSNQEPSEKHAKIFTAFDRKNVLSGNFSPIDELPPTRCEVIEGSLPSCLDGAYFRNGPNPQFLPNGRYYHLFDGDGMIHAIRISRGKATFCSRYVKTNKYNVEKDAGFPIIPFFFTGFESLSTIMNYMVIIAHQFLTRKFDPNKGYGLANTNLANFHNKLYALWEFDLPYAIKLSPDGDIITIGRDNFDGKLLTKMTAHPKFDPITKETFAFRYGPTSPFLTFFWFDESGHKQQDVPIFTARSPCFFHDFGITKNYAIFPENQIMLGLRETVLGWSLLSTSVEKVPRIGVIPRYAKNEAAIKWFNVSGLNVIHVINAWEEDEEDTVVLLTLNMLSVEHALGRLDLIHGSLEKVKINLKTGLVSRHPLSSRNLEFGVINPAYVATKNRYVYCAVGDPIPKFSGVVKLDVSLSEVDRQECIVASKMFEPGCFGGEPFFVARDPENHNADEDDGYLVSYVHNENIDESMFLVMDAKSTTLEIIATVKLPGRVPYGFHGLFVRESDLNKL